MGRRLAAYSPLGEAGFTFTLWRSKVRFQFLPSTRQDPQDPDLILFLEILKDPPGSKDFLIHLRATELYTT